MGHSTNETSQRRHLGKDMRERSELYGLVESGKSNGPYPWVDSHVDRTSRRLGGQRMVQQFVMCWET
jgi:hypothetical protein